MYLFDYGCIHVTDRFNRENPLGLKGTMAKRYAELIRDLWSGKYKSIVPLKFRVSAMSCVCTVRVEIILLLI